MRSPALLGALVLTLFMSFAGTVHAATWQLQDTDYSDLTCPVTSSSASGVYSGIADCPANPSGQACSGTPSTCKVNTISGCGISTSIYHCRETSCQVVETTPASCTQNGTQWVGQSNYRYTGTEAGTWGPQASSCLSACQASGATYCSERIYEYNFLSATQYTCYATNSSAGTPISQQTTFSGGEPNTRTTWNATAKQPTYSCTPPVYSCALSDLTVGNVSPTSATAGSAVTLSATISNGGAASTDSSFVNLWQIDNDGDHGSVYGTFTDTRGPIGSGGTATTQGSYTFPSAGTWYARACADNNASWVGTVSESNEGNNCGNWTSIAVSPPPQPDLVADATSFTPQPQSPWVWAGQPFTFTSIVTNIGNAASGSFPNIFTVESVAVFAANALSLSASQNGAISGSYTFTSPGVYNVRACGDFNTGWVGSVAESNDNNNCGTWASVEVVPAAPAGLSVSCNANGTQATLSWNASSGSSFYYVRTSTSGAGYCPSNMVDVGWGCIPSPDYVSGTSFIANVTPGESYGWWVHGARATGAWGPAGGGSFSCAGAADLTAPSTPSNITATAGQQFTMSANASNGGTATATNFPNTFDIYLTAAVAGNALTLAPNASGAVSADYTLSTPGTYSYRLCVDLNTSWAGSITELNENNNCSGWATLTVNPPPMPDFWVSGPSSDSATVGVAKYFYPSVQNGGTAANTSNFTSTLWVDTDQNTGNGAVATVTVTNHAIPVGTYETVGPSYTFMAGGTFYVRLCADNSPTWVSTITESNENNNCGAWAAVTVGGPDLTVGTASAPGSVTLGSAASVSASASNDGTVTATNFPNMLQYTLNHSQYYYVAANTISSLAAGNSAVVSGSVTFPSTGNWLVRACVDNNTSWVGTVLESNEGNNCGGSWTTVSVLAVPPTAVLTADDAELMEGESTVLRWTSENAVSCTGSEFSTAGAANNQNPGVSVEPDVTTQYQIDCVNSTGQHAYSGQTVSVDTTPTLSITAIPQTVREGNPVLISWSGGTSTSCTVLGPGLVGSGLIGSQSVTITDESTYTLTCTKQSASYQASVTVQMLPAYQEI